MNFNKQRCLALKEESDKLLQQGKCLWDYDKAKNNELIQYLSLLQDDIFWKSRSQYLEILESFISRSINIDELIQKFDQLYGSNMRASEMREENLENEIDFQLNPESRGFTELISSIDMTLELFDPEITFDMNLEHPELMGYGLSEEFLQLDLKNNFLPRIYEYCKKS